MKKRIKFGHYLLKKDLITPKQLIEARIYQIRNNKKVGALAQERGWLKEDQVYRVLAIQEETGGRFCEIAVAENLLTKKQVNELLKLQGDKYMYFGEALVQIGALTEEEVSRHLKDYRANVSD